MKKNSIQPPQTAPQSPPQAATATKLTREDVAKIEIGHTAISTRLAKVLVATFLIIICIVPAIQTVADYTDYRQGQRSSRWPTAFQIAAAPGKAHHLAMQTEGTLLDRILAANASVLRDIAQYEDDLEDNSVACKWLRRPVLLALTGLGGVGNEQAYIGRQGWLFYRPGINSLIGPGFLDARQLAFRSQQGNEFKSPPQPNPLKAILNFRDQLQASGITLVLLPVPDKASIHPDRFSSRFTASSPAIHNPSWAKFRQALEDAGVLLFDPSQLMCQAGHPAQSQTHFLKTDTHWSPQAMQLVASELAEFVRRHNLIDASPAAGFRRISQDISNTGDIADMLRLPPAISYQKEQVTIHPVINASGGFWRSSPVADVLLLGDSFANIYSLQAMGWGESAGFAEQLAFALQRPIDLIARNDDGAFATRQILANELAAGRDRLDGKKIVIWQFAARELAVGDWQLINLLLAERRPSQFISPPQDHALLVEGTIAVISAAPRPGTVTYKDHILSLHLVDVVPQAGTDAAHINGHEAVVYLWSMRDNIRQSAAAMRPGQRVQLALKNWNQIQNDLNRINRSELDDLDLQLEQPCWGEVVE